MKRCGDVSGGVRRGDVGHVVSGADVRDGEPEGRVIKLRLLVVLAAHHAGDDWAVVVARFIEEYVKTTADDVLLRVLRAKKNLQERHAAGVGRVAALGEGQLRGVAVSSLP